jgi:hypothetical protein
LLGHRAFNITPRDNFVTVEDLDVPVYHPILPCGHGYRMSAQTVVHSQWRHCAVLGREDVVRADRTSTSVELVGVTVGLPGSGLTP